MGIRLHKAMAQAGVASRRASEELIRQGQVQVNGQVVTQMGVLVDPERDVIVVSGRRICLPRSHRYVKLYKPPDYLSVMQDDRGRRTLSDLVPDARGLHPVGRLDRNSEGLILLTDDGALTHRLTHPSYEHTKEYLVLVRGVPGESALRVLEQGIHLPDGQTSPAQVERLEETRWGKAPRGQTWLRIVIHEGRKRQIRRMCEAIGHPVRRLIRVRIGSLALGDLAIGTSRPLTRAEFERLRTEVEW